MTRSLASAPRYGARVTWDDVATLISGTGPAHLATADADGQPHVSQVAAVVEGDGLWLCTRRSSAKGRNRVANPAVALMWAGNSAETYVWGSAAPIEDQAERARVVGEVEFPYDPVAFFGPADDPDLLVVRVAPERATAMRSTPEGPRRDTWRA